MSKKEKACNVKKTSIGGQALIEGIMMRGPKKSAMAVRNTEGEIVMEKWDTETANTPKFFKTPVIRGVYNFIMSMKSGYKCLMRSAEISGLEELEAEMAREKEEKKRRKQEQKKGKADPIASNPASVENIKSKNEEAKATVEITEKKEKAKEDKKEKDKKESNAMMNLIMVIAMVLGVGLSILLFIMLPTFLFDLVSGWLPALKPDNAALASLIKSVFEGFLRIAVLVAYMGLVTLMKDIRRTFQYHGAEHKTIFCYEHGKELTVENVRGERRFHPRCGTSFLVLMLLVGIFVSFFIDPLFILLTGEVPHTLIRSLVKLAMLPLIMGIGYELIRLAGRHENAFTRVISAPGMWLQHVTVLEPTDDMIECALKAFIEVLPEDEKAVYDKKEEEKNMIAKMDALSEARKAEIRATRDALVVTGTTYFVSNDGDDEADGKSPETAWRTLAKVSETALEPGDGVRFRRGDLFRGSVKTYPGVGYGAYGEGDKPKLYAGDKSLADPALWELYDAEHHIWHLTEKILDCGTLVMNDGEAHCRKLIPSYRDGRFVCRDDESVPFDMARDMTQDLDMVCFYDERTSTRPTKGEDFPIPIIDTQSYGDLYLRCDKGNPGEIYSELEPLPKRAMMCVGINDNVSIDNLCLKYIGAHAISGGGACLRGLHVTNCEIGWVGGTIQHYAGTDPNYPQGKRGSVTRYGNGVEIYGGCEDYIVENCYIYQMYDAGITHQVTTGGKTYTMKNIRYRNNLVENCVYSIEYFLEKNNGDQESYMDDIEISGNFLRLSGYGWGQQRHNTDTPAHIKGWSYENTASHYVIHDNIFDRAAYRMLHLVAKKAESCPQMYGNTYVQYVGNPIGQYGANEVAEPPILTFDEQAEQTIADVFGDRDAKVYKIK